jgi:hypothetical protein
MWDFVWVEKSKLGTAFLFENQARQGESRRRRLIGLQVGEQRGIAQVIKQKWGISSAGRAPALQAGGRRFDPVILHHFYS